MHWSLFKNKINTQDIKNWKVFGRRKKIKKKMKIKDFSRPSTLMPNYLFKNGREVSKKYSMKEFEKIQVKSMVRNNK